MKKRSLLFLFTAILILSLSAEVKNDDSAYEDSLTKEFSLSNSKNQTFCVYHSLKYIDGFDYNIGKLDCCAWKHKDYMGLKVFWLSNERVIRAYTISTNWKTKRCIKVGDTLAKAKEAYEPDGQLYSFDVKTNEFKKITNKDNYSYEIFDHGDNEGISIIAANMQEEEIMSIGFYAKNGVITKIDIRCGEMQWDQYDKEHEQNNIKNSEKE